MGLLLSAAGCSHMSQSQKRTASYVTGMIVGGAVGSLASDSRKSDSTNKSSTTLGYALVGSSVGFGVGEIFFSDTDKIAKKDAELEVYREFTKNQGRGAVRDLSFDEIRLRNSGTVGRQNPFQKCGKNSDFLMFCASNEGANSLGNCSEPALLYLSDKWAVEFRAYYSDSGCFAGSDFAVVPDFLEYLNQAMVKTGTDLERKGK